MNIFLTEGGSIFKHFLMLWLIRPRILHNHPRNRYHLRWWQISYHPPLPLSHYHYHIQES